MGKEKSNKVGSFFESYAESFDSIYGHRQKRSIVGRITDRFFRKAMYSRFEKTLSNINNDDINSILDVGCGSGRYCIEFLKFEKRVLGIDLADEMIKIASDVCKDQIPNGDIELIQGDYLNYEFDKKFDASVLMGLFDYISNPKVLLGKLKKDTNNIILGSFPKLWNVWTLQRMIRYRIRKCPIYFYTKKQMEDMLKDLGMNNYEITDNGREYYLKVILND